MSKSHDLILNAALDAFSRYGLKRATMSDIAKIAGVSRQTVYSLFESKEKIAQAAADVMKDRLVAKLQNAWQQQSGLEDKLDSYFQLAVVDVYDWLQAMPDGRDLIDNTPAAMSQDYYQRLIELIHDGVFAERQGFPQNIAEFTVITAAQLKSKARSRQHLIDLLATLKLCVLAAGNG